MSDLEKTFKKAAWLIANGPKTSEASTEDKLYLYSHFKQATQGDVSGSQPWAVQVEARAKWDAWNKLKGMSKEEAMQKYIDKVRCAGRRIRIFSLRCFAFPFRLFLFQKSDTKTTSAQSSFSAARLLWRRCKISRCASQMASSRKAIRSGRATTRSRSTRSEIERQRPPAYSRASLMMSSLHCSSSLPVRRARSQTSLSMSSFSKLSDLSPFLRPRYTSR